MTWMKTCLIVIVLVFWACGSGPATDSRDETADTRAVEALVEQYYTENEPGMAFMVMKNDKILFQLTRGVANMDTGDLITQQSNFRLATVTKHITALAALMLSDWGKMDLDASLVELFPGFPAFGDKITPRMLIHHTSGLLAYESLIEADENKPSPGKKLTQVVDADVLDLIKKTDHTYFNPGTEWRYRTLDMRCWRCWWNRLQVSVFRSS